jgi:electron transfer flavoprotein beta subunit
MRIIVAIKQVPETSDVKMDEETGTMLRAGKEAVVNPLDLYAIEAALELREAYGGRVDVWT